MNKVIGENEKYVFYFMEKNITDFLVNPITKIKCHFLSDTSCISRAQWPPVARGSCIRQ